MMQILPDAMSNELVSTITASAMSVAIIQWMKKIQELSLKENSF